MSRNRESRAPRVVSAGEALTDFIRIDTQQWLSRAGGAPWNVARVLATLGVPSAFAGGVSMDRFGDDIAARSLDAGLDMRFLQRYPRPPLLAMVHETAPPKYFFIGEHSADLAFDPKQLPSGWLDALEWLHVGSISLTREPLRAHLLGLVDEVKASGKRLSFDPNFRVIMDERYDATLRYVAERADLIKVSDEDLCGLFRTTNPDDGLARLRALNPHAPILLTRGAGGAQLYAGSTVVTQPSPAIEVIDTVGAGDASMGGLLYSVMTHADASWETHLRYAVATGAAACLQAGATPPTLDQVNKLLAEM